jgi:3-methyladenine DNA glycosylase AlkD/uncharacterized protein YdhG (YjbR/CyaY superfamily)
MTHARNGSRLESLLDDLEQRGTQSVRDGMARYAIPSDTAYGVSVGTLKTMAKTIGTDHALALELWKSGRYEARMLAAFVDDPARVTVAQMDAWCRDFDNWAVCDHACFHLFDRTPHALGRVAAWAGRKPEFQRRAAFALLASVALHDKAVSNASLLATLPLIEEAAVDERNFVKKAVSWALRSLGRRPALRKDATTVARRLAASGNSSARWVGKDALRDLVRDKATRDRADRDRKASSRSALQRSSEAGVIDAYLARLAPGPRAALERLRKQIREAAPGAEECISYGLPAFRLDGPLVAFGATSKHCAFYPMSGTIVGALAADLEEFDVSKGTIRFQPDQPLPAALVRKIVRARIRENAAA